MAIQISDARTSLKRLKHDIDDIDDVAGTFLEWCNFANRQIYNCLCGIDLNRFVTAQSYTAVTSGPQSLPSDLMTMRGLGLGVFPLDSTGAPTGQRLAPTEFGSRKVGYYFERGNIVFTGIPNPTSYVMRYLPKPVTFTADTEYFTLDGLITGVETVVSRTKLRKLG